MTERNTFGCLIRAAVVITVLVIVVTTPVTMALWFWGRSAKSRVEELTAGIRQQQMPTSRLEARSYYDDAIEQPDITNEWLSAIAPFGNEDMQKAESEAEFVGFRGGQQFPLPGTPWPDREKAVEYLRERQSILDEIHRVAGLRGDVRYPIDLSYTAGFGHLQTLRSAARLLSLEALVAAYDRDEARFIESVMAMLKAAETLDDEPLCISYLVHIAIDQMACQTIHVGSGYLDFTPGNSTRLLNELFRRDYPSMLTRSLAGERGIAADYFSDISQLAGDEVIGDPSLKAYPFKYQDLSNYLEFMTAYIDASLQDFPAAIDAMSAVNNRFDDSRRDWKTYTQIISNVLLPATDAMVRATARACVVSRSTATAVAAEIYRHENGNWPDELMSLVPEHLTAVPVDP